MKGPMPGSRRIELVRLPHLSGHGLRLTVEFDLSAATYTRVAKAMAAGDHRAAREVLLAALPGAGPCLDNFFEELIHFQTIDENPLPHDPAFQARVEGLLAGMGVPTDAVR